MNNPITRNSILNQQDVKGQSDYGSPASSPMIPQFKEYVANIIHKFSYSPSPNSLISQSRALGPFKKNRPNSQSAGKK
jgi:hypothetical protein